MSATLDTPRDPRILVVRRVTWLLVIVAAILLAWWWFEMLRAEDARPAASSGASRGIDLAIAVDAAATSRAFGTEVVAPRRVATPAPVAVESDIKVRGIYALAGGAQMAIVDAGQGDRAVRVGNEIVDGVKLAAVAPNHIVVRRDGRDEKIMIDFSGKDRPAGPGALARPPGLPQPVPTPMFGRQQTPPPPPPPEGNEAETGLPNPPAGTPTQRRRDVRAPQTSG